MWNKPCTSRALAFGAGALLPLSFSPFYLWWLTLPALALYATLLQRSATPRQAFWLGGALGLGLFGVGCSWVYVSIHRFGGAPLPLAALLTALFCATLALFTAGHGWLCRRWQPPAASVRWGLWFACSWTLLEWLRSHLLTGFPWLLLGDAQVDGPLRSWLPLVGSLGITFLLAASAAALALLLQRQPRLAIGLVPLWLAAIPLASLHWSEPSGTPREVALVQANVSQSIKWDRHYRREILARYERLSAPLYDQVDLLIWPEAALPGFYQQLAPFVDSQAALAEQGGSALLLGIPYWVTGEDGSLASGSARNSLMVVSHGEGLYHKQRLVPFGEYVPLQRWLRGLIAFFDLPMSNFYPGRSDQPPLQAAGLQLAPALCYEIAYADLVRRQASASDLLLTLSNDAWFGDSLGPKQHLQIARVRAVENARPLIRATGSGITAIVAPDGALLARIAPFKEGVLRHSVTPYRGDTPFMQIGPHAIAALLCLLAIALVYRPRR